MNRRDRVLGALCFVACPAASGVFLGLVATLCSFSTGGPHALEIGALVAIATFAANALAISLSSIAAESHAQRRAHRTPRVLAFAPVPQARVVPALNRRFVVPRPHDELEQRLS